MASELEKDMKSVVDRQKLPAIGAIALDAAGKELFKAAFGATNVQEADAPAFTTTTPLLIFSCTKLVTSVAALQLLEQSKIALDDPVEKYAPSIADIQVLTGFGEDGKPQLRAPSKKPTVLNLLTHTSGLTYDFFDKDTLAWRIAVGQAPCEYIAVSTLVNYLTPFRHDPGSDWTYGVNSDFLGFVIEKASGMKLQDYIHANILQPLGLKNTGLDTQEGNNWLTMHMKDEAGKLTPNPAVRAPKDGEVTAGGHFLTSTIEEYAQFLLTILNEGTHPDGTKILEAKTVKDYLFTDFIPQICSNKEVGVITSSVAALSNEGEFMPTVSKGWSCGLLLNNDDLPNGRAKGSGAWAGLGNLYYWIDPTNGKLGLIASGVFPFLDTEVVRLFDGLERMVYGKDVSAAGKSGSNYMLTKVIDAQA